MAAPGASSTPSPPGDDALLLPIQLCPSQPQGPRGAGFLSEEGRGLGAGGMLVLALGSE